MILARGGTRVGTIVAMGWTGMDSIGIRGSGTRDGSDETVFIVFSFFFFY